MIVCTDALTLALLRLAARGERAHCSDPTSHHLWLSEHEAERAIAVMLCDHCPVLTVCRDTAKQRDERWGVWGGRYDTPTREGSMIERSKCEKVYLKVVAASGAAEQFRRYGTSGLMPGVRRVRTSSSATRISLMLLSWETRRITLKAWSASIL
jgi:hypothetical protein